MAVEETSCIVSSSSISLLGRAWDLGAGWVEFIRTVLGTSDVHQAASERQTEYNTVLENHPTATENEVDDLLLGASQAYKAEEASERQTEEPPTATENESAMISCLELRKPTRRMRCPSGKPRNLQLLERRALGHISVT